MLQLLKPGGRLIIGVPDNSVRAARGIIVGYDSVLNMPPHHQSLWDLPSLAFLAKLFPLRLDALLVEPATASHHSNTYRGLMKQDLRKRLGRVLGYGLYGLGRPFYDHALAQLNPHLPAHTVLAVYTKKHVRSLTG
jgi:hypothetical protein